MGKALSDATLDKAKWDEKELDLPEGARTFASSGLIL
jgi:hypothetical protein